MTNLCQDIGDSSDHYFMRQAPHLPGQPHARVPARGDARLSLPQFVSAENGAAAP